MCIRDSDQEEAMSISDRIAVMRDGKLQQYDIPQRIYKAPANRFVATFLGSPPINLFAAQVKNGMLTAGETVLAPAPHAAPGPTLAGIRPEAFVPDPNGFAVTVQKAELLGRDIIITFPLGGQAVKAIVSSDDDVKPGDTLRLKVKPGQILQFDEATQALIGSL
jgi:multiple sugar transport system ATP-binding protein